MAKRLVASAIITFALVGGPFVVSAPSSGPMPVLALPYTPGFYGTWLLQHLGLVLSDDTGDISLAEQIAFVSISAIFWFGVALSVLAIVQRLHRRLIDAVAETDS